MNNAQKFDQLKEEIRLFIEEKKVDGLIDSDIKKEIAKPEKRWFWRNFKNCSTMVPNIK